MTELILISLAVAFILSAVEELLIFLGKWRGLLAGVLSLIGSYAIVDSSWSKIAITALASSFLGITVSLLVKTLLEVNEPRTVRGLPRRVPPL